MESGYYPPGAEHDPNAPYNQVTPKDIDIKVCVSTTLSKSTTISVNDYITEVWEDIETDDEGHTYKTGGLEYDFSNSDLKSAYEEQEYTIPDLLEELSKFLKKNIEINETTIKSLNDNMQSAKRALQNEINSWNNMLRAAKDWTVDEIEVIKE